MRGGGRAVLIVFYLKYTYSDSGAYEVKESIKDGYFRFAKKVCVTHYVSAAPE